MQTEPISLITGTLLCTAALLRTVYGIHALLRNRRQQVQQADLDAEAFRQEAQALAAATKARLSQGLAWEGRKRLRISGIVEESDDIKSFYLTSPEGRPLPALLAWPIHYGRVADQSGIGTSRSLLYAFLIDHEVTTTGSRSNDSKPLWTSHLPRPARLAIGCTTT